jgi:hypothetical protein
MKDEALKLALAALEWNLPVIEDYGDKEQLNRQHKAITAIKQALAAPVQEPVAWKWHQAPVKTSWGHDMVVADLAIDRDNTVSVYCERDHTAKVEAMFSTPPAVQRQWVGLTDEEINAAASCQSWRPFARAIEAKLKEKNT